MAQTINLKVDPIIHAMVKQVAAYRGMKIADLYNEYMTESVNKEVKKYNITIKPAKR